MTEIKESDIELMFGGVPRRPAALGVPPVLAASAPERPSAPAPRYNMFSTNAYMLVYRRIDGQAVDVKSEFLCENVKIPDYVTKKISEENDAFLKVWLLECRLTVSGKRGVDQESG